MSNPTAATERHVRAREPAPETGAFIGGQYVDAMRGGVFAAIDRATGHGDAARALAAQHRPNTGFVAINTPRAGDITTLPGGVKLSDQGCDESLHAVCNLARRRSARLDPDTAR